MCVLRRSSTCLGDKRNKKGEKNDRLKFYDSSPYHLTCRRVFHVSFHHEEGLPHINLYVHSPPLLPLFPHIYSLPLLLVSFTSFSSIKTPHLFTLTLHTQTPLKLQLMEDIWKLFSHEVCRKCGVKEKRITKKCGGSVSSKIVVCGFSMCLYVCVCM